MLSAKETIVRLIQDRATQKTYKVHLEEATNGILRAAHFLKRLDSSLSNHSAFIKVFEKISDHVVAIAVCTAVIEQEGVPRKESLKACLIAAIEASFERRDIDQMVQSVRSAILPKR